MSAKLFALPRQTPLTNSGALIPGAKAYFYLQGSTTPQTVYQNVNLTVAHTNPVVADGFGRFPMVFLNSELRYKVSITDASDVEIYNDDDFQDLALTGNEILLQSGAPYIRFIETSAGADNGVWEIDADGEAFTLKIGDDALTTFTPFMTVNRTGMTVDSVEFASGALTLGGLGVATQSAGTFSATPTGVSSPTAGTIAYAVAGSVVTLSVTLLVGGNSNATTFTATGVPAAIRPATQKTISTYVADTGIANLFPAIVQVQTDGTLEFFIDSPFSATGFTNDSNVKGLPVGWSITYDLS